MQTDPVGYEDSLNLYAYVGNDPLNAVDLSGMEGIGHFIRGLFGLNRDQLEDRYNELADQQNNNGNLITVEGEGGLNFYFVDDSALGDSLLTDSEAAEIAGKVFPNAIALAAGGLTSGVTRTTVQAAQVPQTCISHCCNSRGNRRGATWIQGW